MPHAEPIDHRGRTNSVPQGPNNGQSGLRPVSVDTDRASSKSGTNSDKFSRANIRSKFRELGLTTGAHGISRQKSLNRNDGVSGHASFTRARKEPVLPFIKTDEFMPEYNLKRRVMQLRREVADMKVQVQILEKRTAEIKAQRLALRDRIEADKQKVVQVEESRRAKFDVWAGRLNRRKAGDTQLWTARVAKRAPSERSVDSEKRYSLSEYSTDAPTEMS